MSMFSLPLRPEGKGALVFFIADGKGDTLML